MSNFFNDLGELTDERGHKLAKRIGKMTDKLIHELFAEGLTIIEARALGEYLKGQVDVSILMEALRQRCVIAERQERQRK